MSSYTNFQITNNKGYPVDIDLFHSRTQKTGISPLLIFCHGFKGFKDWGGFPHMMTKISDSGIAALSFNFSMNGVSPENPSEFVRLDLFAKNTFSQELDDLKLVIDHLFDNHEEYGIDRNRIALAGHSRGGGIAVIKAKEDERIKCLITLASLSSFDRYTPEHKQLWRSRGYFEALNTRTNQMMRMDSTLLDDIENNKNRLDIVEAVSRLHIPFLIIHGKEDLSVRFEEGETIYDNSNKKLSELFEVPNTGHTFGVEHPFKGSTSAFEKVIDKMIEFLGKNLKQSTG